jgi:exodeoxyribonuclease X
MTHLKLPAALDARPLIVVDIEGNGRQPPEIIEIAALHLADTATAEDLHSWLVRPTHTIAPMVTRKVHGITDSDVAGSPTWPELAEEIQELLNDRVLIAHNASVEYRVLRDHLPGWHPPLVLDTLRFAKRVWPGLPGYGLDALIEYARLDTASGTVAGLRHHRAAYDVWATAQLFTALARDSDLDWPALVGAAVLPTTRADSPSVPTPKNAPNEERLW